ncbi:cytochrome P450 monooxygenase-like protein [Xylaria bambusicola]|uniref:cytochrome P450 monooxygenase-like protein n=1 Tax=Xylaria bambusicola TaxID=326684 RepID=UPI0020086956|nr:cytochrome P450 monooxygenase-like protein [Xylaria bambusicola]KAI0502885.1 cytochrome P450 monooxygenase-like protein [Xylaria bambusicola]
MDLPVVPVVHVAALSAAAGVVSHLTYFIRGEHMLTAYILVIITILSPPTAVAVLTMLAGLPFSYAARLTVISYGAYVTTLFTSILVYRAFFHPLRHFPGPKLARLSQFYHFFRIRAKVDNYRHLDRLHAQYGEYVRVGPNLLSISDPSMIEIIFHPQSQFNKAEWYDIANPLLNLVQLRDRAEHDRRRRHGWDLAFTTKALRSYDSRVLKYADQFVTQMQRRVGQAVNVTDWLEWYAFDVMGDLAFGRSFKALEHGKSHIYIDTMHQTSALPLGCLGTMPWVIQTMTALIPQRLNPFMTLVRYSNECIEERKQRKPAEPDIMTPILAAGPFYEDPKADALLLLGDARLIIIAGSDTSATTLIHSFYELARDANVVQKIRDELEQHGIRNDDSLSVTGIQHLEYLNAFINETLRMHPTNPGGLFRLTPPGGVELGGHYLPGGVKIVNPHYSVHRSPKAFVAPNEFIPERWTTRSELIRNKKAFTPFSQGRFACIGRNLALNELRVVISKAVLEFDISFAPGETGRALLEDSKDIFTMSLARLELRFTKRLQR